MDLMCHLIELFCTRTNTQFKSLISPAQINERILTKSISRGLLLAICASSMRFSVHPTARQPGSADLAQKLGEEARSCVHARMLNQPQIDNVRTICILVDFEASRGCGRRAWVDIAMGRSLVQLARSSPSMDSDSTQVLDAAEQYLAVAELSHSIGHASLQPTRGRRVRRPRPDNRLPLFPEGTRCLLELLEALIRIDQLCSTPLTEHNPAPWSTDSHFRVLQDELEEYLLWYPSIFRMGPKEPPGRTEQEDNDACMSSLVWHCCAILLNRTFLPIPESTLFSSAIAVVENLKLIFIVLRAVRTFYSPAQEWIDALFRAHDISTPLRHVSGNPNLAFRSYFSRFMDIEEPAFLPLDDPKSRDGPDSISNAEAPGADVNASGPATDQAAQAESSSEWLQTYVGHLSGDIHDEDALDEFPEPASMGRKGLLDHALGVAEPAGTEEKRNGQSADLAGAMVVSKGFAPCSQPTDLMSGTANDPGNGRSSLACDIDEMYPELFSQIPSLGDFMGMGQEMAIFPRLGSLMDGEDIWADVLGNTILYRLLRRVITYISLQVPDHGRNSAMTRLLDAALSRCPIKQIVRSVRVAISKTVTPQKPRPRRHYGTDKRTPDSEPRRSSSCRVLVPLLLTHKSCRYLLEEHPAMERNLPRVERRNDKGACWSCLDKNWVCDGALPQADCGLCLLRMQDLFAARCALSRLRLTRVLENIARIALAIDYDGNGYRSLLPMAMQEPALMGAAMAVAESHYSRWQHTSDVTSRKYLRAAAKALRNRFTTPALVHSPATLASMLLFVSYEVFAGSSRWKGHYDAIKGWIRSRGDCSDLDPFLKTWVCLLDTQSALNTGSPAMPELESWLAGTIDGTNQEESVDALFGCSSKLPKLMWAASRLYAVSKTTDMSHHDLTTQAEALQAEISATEIALDSHPLVGISCNGTPASFSTAVDIDQEELRRRMVATAEIFRHASHIYVYRIVHGPEEPLTAEMRASLDTVQHLLTVVPDALGPGANLGWCFVVLGAEMDLLHERDYVRSRWAGLHLLGIYNTKNGQKILEETWSHRDLVNQGQASPERWQDIMQRIGQSQILV
ncbi:hypothetical protein AK830_g4619 [Neonectria ditissima]|uniref:Zn(2)-C6 fungal-type domain-containing protein n=1 Tax=Neonectria ditissima TaxID=78410 RepID=A0A0P7B7V9_9HYPO|nr:hypothetical protein AK830_g4619 [Neonectria ditissima]